MNAVTTEERPGYLAVFQANLGDGKSLSLQFNVSQGATEKDWASTIDLLANVVDRQIARAELPRAKNQLIVKQGIASNIEEDITRLQETIALKEKAVDPERRTQASVTGEVGNLAAQKAALVKVRREIEDHKTLIKELEKKAA